MTGHDRHEFYIDGAWVAPSDRSARIPVHSAITEEVMATIPAGNHVDVDRAVQAAHRAFPLWSSLSVGERASFMRKLADGLRARAGDIAPLITQEVGMPSAGSMDHQSVRSADFFENFAARGTVADAWAGSAESRGRALPKLFTDLMVNVLSRYRLWSGGIGAPVT